MPVSFIFCYVAFLTPIFALVWIFILLVTDSLYLVCMAKISILKKEVIIEKISYERRAYESVDDRSHS